MNATNGIRAVRPAAAEDAGPLTELAMRSKAHWGYGAEFMAMCRPELTMTLARIVEEAVVVAEDACGQIVGFASFARGTDGMAEVMTCFVEPAAIGGYVGCGLMAELIARARAEGIVAMMVDSDPHAEGFYRRLGFRRVGEAPSGSIPGRTLPRLRLDL